MKPNAVCLDPILCRSLNKFQRATSGFDAFCQSIESLWAVGANDQSKGYAGKALSLISKNIKENVNSPTLENTEAMLQGSHFSGKAINISKTTVAHALSYYLTTNFNIPHGYAASIMLGVFLDAHDQVKEDKMLPKKSYMEFRQGLEFIYESLGVNNGSDAKHKWYEIMNLCGLDLSLKQILNSKESVKSLVESVNIQRLSNNPVKYDQLDLVRLIENNSINT